MHACGELSSRELHWQFAAARETREAVTSRLRSRGIQPQDLEDMTQEVLEELCGATPTQTLKECIVLALHIANQRAIDYLRRRASRGRHNVGLTDQADAHVHDENAATSSLTSIDTKRKLEVFQQEVDAGRISKRQVTIAMHAADGLDHVQIARSMKLSEQTVRNIASDTRKTSRNAWAKYVGALVAVGILLVLFFKRPRGEPDATPAPRPHPTPTISEHPPTPTPPERAAELRRNALHDCDMGNMQRCLEKLDQAKELDPAGDSAPAVQRARERIRDFPSRPDKR
jgi:DNA-directed RNA polymerase specialized sigma24 family protein